MSIYRGPSKIGESADNTVKMVLSAISSATTAANAANAASASEINSKISELAAAASALALATYEGLTSADSAAAEASRVVAVAAALESLNKSVEATNAAAASTASANIASEKAAEVVTIATNIGLVQDAVNTVVAGKADTIAQTNIAVAAKDAAILARDASFVTGPKYANEETGRAAVADGVNFMVQGAGEVAAYEYRRTSSSVSVLIATYNSKAAIDAFGQVWSADSFTFQGYVANGTYFANALYRATDYLHIEGGANYTVTTQTAGTLTHDWYNANKAHISSFTSTPQYQIVTTTATAPANARYLRVSGMLGVENDARCGVYATVSKLNIDKVLKIVNDNPQLLLSTGVTHGTGTVKTKLDSIDATQAFVLTQQANMLNSIDLIGDTAAPFFVNTWAFTKSAYGTTANNPVEVPILSRVSDDTFTVDPANATKLSVTQGSIVVKDDALNRYKSYGVKDNTGGTVTVFGTLPASITAAQAMHDTNEGQHLSRFGYKGLADFIVEQSQRYAYKKKKPLFAYHPPACSSPMWNDPHIYNYSNTTKLINVTLLGGAGNGGYVAGSNSTISRSCGQAAEDTSIALDILSVFQSRCYCLNQSGIGDGFEIKFPAYGVTGFIDLPISATRHLYDTDKYTAGRVRVQVIGDGSVSLHDSIYDAGVVNYLKVPFSGVQEIAVRITLADAVPTMIALGGIYAYAKSADTVTTGFFNSGDVVGFLGDSWTQFPYNVAGETLPIRPDGSTGSGMQFLSVRLKERLAQDGIAITTFNMGQSGRTSAWGRYWVSKIAELTPKPTHCVVCFYINDNNSPAFPVDTSYTIDPSNMWGSKNVSLGGVKGVVSAAEWYANMEYICTRLLSSGIKPIVMMPSHTASASQAQSIQQGFLSKMTAGFNPLNAIGGRP